MITRTRTTEMLIGIIGAALILIGLFSAKAYGEDGDLSPEAVRESIRGGIAYLGEIQQKDGSWNEYPGFEPGTTALCTLALITAGVDKNDPVLLKALDFLRRPLPESRYQTYPLSLQTMVLCLADPEKDKESIRKNVEWLIAHQFQTNNVFRGGWSYVGSHPEFDQVDNSNSQFAILALYEAERIGIPIDPEIWKRALEYWKRMQNKDGSWGYRASLGDLQVNKSGVGTGSMTCAGIAGLVISSGFRNQSGSRVQGDEVLCCQEVDDDISNRIEKGLNWLSRHFSVQTNPGTVVDVDTWLFYYLYGLERVGRLTAHRFIGKSDWYREGADFLLRRKGMLNKYWKAQRDLKNNNAVSTAFALLFLSKGRRPVLISKLKYGSDDQWNLHPNDLLHLTRKVEKSWKMDLIWQVIDSEKATVDDLIQTPVLYMNGTKSPIPSDPNRKKQLIRALKGYLEQGGFIFAEALDNDISFEQGMIDLIREVLPEEGNEFQLLESDHPIWNAERTVPPDQIRPIYGIDYGCRTSIVLVPSWKRKEKADSVFNVRASLSCLWETDRPDRSGDEPLPDRIRIQVESALDIGENVLAYATNREMKSKDEIPESIQKELAKTENRQGAIYTAILEHGGGSSCAPRAIPNLMKAIRKELEIPVQTFVQRLRAGSADLFHYPILFMHGRNAFRFSEEEKKNLSLYFDRGGFLFANAVGASESFQKSFAGEFKEIFPESRLEKIPLDDPLFSNLYGGFVIRTVEIRKPSSKGDRKAPSLQSEEPPELWGIKKEGRWIVVFSPWDVSCALERSGSYEYKGYSWKSAFILSANILLYAIENL
ncbi:MAG: DUF4159 domain-containing protein [Planctomycetia bacterium]|nr:DUF4159 domain-containing protein [Planctomycetia bacterium]